MINEDKDELITELNDHLNKFQNMIYDVRELIRELDDCHGTGLYERANRMVLAHIETALSHDHEWASGNMTTLQDIINEANDQ